jgi:hypothetical protein
MYPAQGFWSRQFTDPITKRQVRFDLTWGVLVPVLALVLDPIIFKGGGTILGPPRLEHLRVLAYTCCSINVAILAVWLWRRRAPAPLAAFAGGALLGGAIASVLVGVVILWHYWPLLMTIVGVLQLVPFPLAFVLLRNSVRLLRRPLKDLAPSRWLPPVLVAACLCSVVPASIGYTQWATSTKAKLIRMIEGTRNDGILRIVDATDVAWNHLHVIGPYTSGHEIDQQLGFTWSSPAKDWVRGDGRQLLVLTKDGEVVEYFSMPSVHADFRCGEKGEAVYRRRLTPESAVFRVQRRGPSLHGWPQLCPVDPADD